jgi:hypothetical protein
MDPDNELDTDDEEEALEHERRMLIAQAAAIFVNATVSGAILAVESLYNKTPYHTSALTGADWV